MRPALLIAAAVALLGAGIARAETSPPIGYVDVNKATRDTADAKAAQAKANALFENHVSEIQAAPTEAKRNELNQRYTGQAQQLLGLAQTLLLARAERLLPKIRDEHKLGMLSDAGPGSASGVLVPPPKLDYTAELTKRLDAGDGKTDEQAQAELQRKNQDQAREIAELRAKVAEAKKSEPTPSPPAAPPIAPRTAVAKK